MTHFTPPPPALSQGFRRHSAEHGPFPARIGTTNPADRDRQFTGSGGQRRLRHQTESEPGLARSNTSRQNLDWPGPEPADRGPAQSGCAPVFRRGTQLPLRLRSG